MLPQRQIALVAKQAAEVDVLSAGRLRLGVGVGWNAVEYQALGENFHDRGRRIEEQIALLRAPWTEPVVDFQGRWHRVPDAGLNPLPMQRPIPVWLGGQAEPVDAGRDPDRIGVEPRVEKRYGEPSRWPALVDAWRELGATHMGVSTRGLGLTGADHVTAIERLHRELVS